MNGMLRGLLQSVAGAVVGLAVAWVGADSRYVKVRDFEKHAETVCITNEAFSKYEAIEMVQTQAIESIRRRMIRDEERQRWIQATIGAVAKRAGVPVPKAPALDEEE